MHSQNYEPVTFQRDCQAIMVPSGEEVNMPAGTVGYITQALGGSFSIYVEGYLFRVAGQDADALGKAVIEPPKLPKNATDKDIESLVWQQMKTCFDPEIPINVVELGLIYQCNIKKTTENKRIVSVVMTLTAPGCGMGDIIVDDVRSKIALVPTITAVDVELVFDPPWNHDMMSDVAKLETGML